MEGNLKQIVDVNDSRHRYYIVRSATIAEIETFSGASLTVKGKYYPDRNLATEKDPPLCVEVAATSGEVLQKAINRIMELKETGPPTPKPPSLLTVKVVAPFDPETCCPPGISIRQKILGPQVRTTLSLNEGIISFFFQISRGPFSNIFNEKRELESIYEAKEVVM